MSRKLLFVASSYIHILNFHLPYLRALHEEGLEIHAGCAAPQADIPWADRTLSFPFEKKMSAPSNFRAAAQLRRLIRREGYGLVIVHTSLAAFFTRLAMWGMRDRRKVVNMVHGYLFDDATPFPKRQIMLWAERLTAPQTDLLLTMNEWDYELAKRCRLAKRVELIPGVGVDFGRLRRQGPEAAAELRGSLGIAPDAFVLFCAAELSKRKSQHVLISALARLPERAVLVLAGSGAEEEKLRRQTEELGVSGRVFFPGYIRGLETWYAMADAVVSASRIEGLPFNIMEAMYLERPIVASAIKGHVDLLTDGESGLLVPYGDADAYADAILRLMDDPGLGAELTKRAAEQVLRFSLEEAFPRIMRYYGGQPTKEDEKTGAVSR